MKAYIDLNVVINETFDKGKIEGKIELLQEKTIKLLNKKLGKIPKEMKKKYKTVMK